MDSQTTNLLALNDGWTQIPPTADGEYWMANSKPWHSENAYDTALMPIVRIKDGKRVEEAVRYGDDDNEVWAKPDCDAPNNPVWDYNSQYEMLAAWKPRLPGENFGNPPPQPSPVIFERHPAKCPACGKVAAIYRADGANPFVCWSCGKTGMMNKDYFNRKFSNALKAALEADDATRSANDEVRDPAT